MTDTARMLDDTTARLLARRLDDPFADRAAMRAELLAETMEAGLPLALVPENEGGLGGSLAEAAVIAWRWGWYAAPLPVVPMLLSPLLDEGWAEGHTTLSATRLSLEGDRLRGPRVTAPVMDDTQKILAICDTPEDPVLAIMSTEGAETFHALDGAPWLSLDPATARFETRPCTLSQEDLLAQGALLTAAAMGGAMARVQEIVIEHANTRKQFGRPLGKFQAIQHRIAEAVGEATVAEAALSGAIAAVDAGTARPIHWQSAKAQSGRAATILAAAAHQILGAIGFTDEHALHHYTKRLWVWRDDWGRQSAMEAAIGRAAAADPRGLWSHLVDDAA